MRNLLKSKKILNFKNRSRMTKKFQRIKKLKNKRNKKNLMISH